MTQAESLASLYNHKHFPRSLKFQARVRCSLFKKIKTEDSTFDIFRFSDNSILIFDAISENTMPEIAIWEDPDHPIVTG